MTTTEAEPGNGSPSTPPLKPKKTRSDKGTTRQPKPEKASAENVKAARTLLDLAQRNPVILSDATPEEVNRLSSFADMLVTYAKNFRQRQLDLWSGNTK